MTIRISAAGRATLDQFAEALDLSVSEVSRRMLAYGIRHPQEALAEPEQAESGAA